MEEKHITKIENKDSYGLTWYEHAKPYLGSHHGMRFRIARDPMDDCFLTPPDKKGDATFLITIWPEPYCYEATPEEQKVSEHFPFTMAGKEEMIEWLNRQYEERYEEWEEARKAPLI